MTIPTPGPWEQHGSMVFAPGEHGANICALSEPRATTTVAYTPLHSGSPDADEAYANARLIAAAPDLLAACAMLQDFWMNPESLAQVPTILNVVQAAIAKARGEGQP